MGDVAGKPQGDELILERPHIYEFEKALISIGMEESDAKRYALSTGRSWTVLRRQLQQTRQSGARDGWMFPNQPVSPHFVCWVPGVQTKKRTAW